jgi:hypothetical protein
VPHDRRVEVALVREVVVNQPARNAGLLGDLLNPDVIERLFREKLRADLDELLAPLFWRQACPFLGVERDEKLRSEC